MKVFMTHTQAGPGGCYAAGGVYHVAADVGRGLVDAGYATSPDYDKTAKPGGKPAAAAVKDKDKGKGGGDAGDA